jgi:hypothetical protein
MALEKVVEVDQIEVKGEYSIQVRTATKVMDNGVQIGGISYHRHVVHPNSLLDNEDAKVKKISESLWGDAEKEEFFVSQNGYPSGDPSDSWSKAQLQKYCKMFTIDYEENDSKAKLVEKIEAAKGE